MALYAIPVHIAIYKIPLIFLVRIPLTIGNSMEVDGDASK